MLIYLLRRLNLLVATSLSMIAVLFFATALFPIEHTLALSGIDDPSPAQLVQIKQDYRLEDNQAGQFIGYLTQRLSGNLGRSITSQHSVAEELSEVFPASIELALIAGLLAIVFGVPLGVLASLSRHKLTQHTIMVLTLTGYSVPVFWLGLSLSLWFGVELGWLPISGQLNLLYEINPFTGFMLIDILLSDSPYRIAAFQDACLHIILPAITLAVLPFTVVVRTTRSALINVMNQTFIMAAETRGLQTHTIVIRHGLPNALLPVLKNFGLMLGTFASYGIVVETIFSWPGVGSWLVSGLYQGDYTVIQAGILAVSLLIIFLNIAIDVLYTTTNPMSRKELYAAH